MVTLQFKWKKKQGRFQIGGSLYLNRVCVGSYEWNSTRTQGTVNSEPDWIGTSLLPQLTKLYSDNDQQKLKLQIEKAVIAWFNEVLKEGE